MNDIRDVRIWGFLSLLSCNHSNVILENGALPFIVSHKREGLCNSRQPNKTKRSVKLLFDDY